MHTGRLTLGVIGGLSVMGLFAAFAYTDLFRHLMVASSLAIGACVGLEIPILMRILGDDLDLRDLVSKVFTFDYIGALIALLVAATYLAAAYMILIGREDEFLYFQF